MFRLLILQTKNYAQQQSRQYAQRHQYRPNQGVRRQAKAGTNETEPDMPDWNDDLSKYEGDLSNTRDTYEEQQREAEMLKENLKRNIVRSKYFNEKNVSFLTWAEMEQIRILNAKDSEEWDEQKLAESFPADISTIRKILKRKWQPRDDKRIVKHDERVRQNWKAFVNGEINITDSKLNEHLNKFSTRNLNLKVDYDSVLQKELPKPESTEFLRIITSCKKYKEEPKQFCLQEPLEGTNTSLETSVQPTNTKLKSKTIKSNKLYTFKPSDVDNETSGVDSEAEIIFNNPSGTGIKNPINSVNAIDKYENNEVQLDANDMKQLSVLSIPQHISIPANLFKKGATYRLDDCYYDDDGEFLYRVPGMTKC